VISTLVAMDLLINTLQETAKDTPDKWDGLWFWKYAPLIDTTSWLGFI